MAKARLIVRNWKDWDKFVQEINYLATPLR